MFSAVDADGSGQISLYEFSSWWTARQLATTGSLNKGLVDELQRQWRKYDTDRSGELDEQEFARVIDTVVAEEWEQRYDVAQARAYFLNRSTGERRDHPPDSGSAVEAFLKKNGIDVQRAWKTPRFLPFGASHTTLQQDVDDWEVTSLHKHINPNLPLSCWPKHTSNLLLSVGLFLTDCLWLTARDRALSLSVSRGGRTGIRGSPDWLGYHVDAHEMADVCVRLRWGWIGEVLPGCEGWTTGYRVVAGRPTTCSPVDRPTSH